MSIWGSFFITMRRFKLVEFKFSEHPVHPFFNTICEMCPTEYLHDMNMREEEPLNQMRDYLQSTFYDNIRIQNDQQTTLPA
jgi:hypothetical protein